MKSYYEVGNLLGKGNFAKVYEATNFKTKEKFALKTIEKKILSKNKRNFVTLYTLSLLLFLVRFTIRSNIVAESRSREYYTFA